MASGGLQALARRLAGFDELVSSSLLEAELRAALEAEKAPTDLEFLSWVSWILPDRPLNQEITQVLAAAHLRGADLWHVACALYLVNTPRELSFITLDERQSAVARQLGFSD